MLLYQLFVTVTLSSLASLRPCESVARKVSVQRSGEPSYFVTFASAQRTLLAPSWRSRLRGEILPPSQRLRETRHG